jgi:2-haloacid dehalogenase
MTATLGFDIFGTLIDTAGIAEALREHVGDEADAFAALWRSKQLEYVFRRGSMDRYRDFAACTRDALDYCCLHFRASVTAAERQSLLERYRFLPAFPDARPGLESLEREGFRIFAFSMGRREDLGALLDNAKLRDYFVDIVSLVDAGCLKPNPAAYRYFVERTATAPADAWLVSGNPFDVLGAVSAGICGAWVKRSPEAVMDPWEIQPTLIAEDLPRLCESLVARTRAATAPG